MRSTRVALPLVVLFAAACGGAAPELPADDTLSIQSPLTEDAASQGLSNCPAGDDAFGQDARVEFDELLAATRPYRELYRGLRKVAKATRSNGKFEHTWTGPKGHITVVSEEAADGSLTISVTAQAAGEESADRKVMEGTVRPDGLSGHWDVFNKAGEAVRTIDWTRTAAGDLTSTWVNSRNGKTATYSLTGTSAEFKLTRRDGASLDVTWDTVTHAGRATLTSTGHSGEKCWDANLCNATCTP